MDTLEISQIQKPTNRGKFSPDRDVWDQIHQQRFVQWQMGASVEDIAQSEGVTPNAIRHSIAKCEVNLSGREVLAARDLRLKLRTIDRLGPKCLEALDGLLSDENSIVRLKAVEQIRKMISAEQAAGVQVNTQVNLAHSSPSELLDFETEIARLKESQKVAHQKAIEVEVKG